MSDEYYIVEPSKNPEEYVAPRHRHSNVDRFIPVFRRVLQGAYEIRFKHDDIGLNANTALCRLRDASYAIRTGKAFHEEIDADVLRKNWPLYKLSSDQLSREIVLRRPTEHQAMSGNVISYTLCTDDPHFRDALINFAGLFGHCGVRGGITVLGMLDDAFKIQLSDKYGVFFTQTTANEHVMT